MGSARFFTLSELNEEERQGKYLGLPYTLQRLVLESDFRDIVKKAFLDGAYWRSGGNFNKTFKEVEEAARFWIAEELAAMNRGKE